MVADPLSVPIVFVVGSSRSGTTMLSRVLGNHSRILGLEELHYIDRQWIPNRDSRWDFDRAVRESANLLAVAKRSLWGAGAGNLEIMEAREVVSSLGEGDFDPAQIFGGTLALLLKKVDKRIVIDQTPRNVLYAKEILSTFQNCHIVQLVRDPRAVLYSQKNRWRQKWLGARQTPWWNVVRVMVNYHPFTTTRLWIEAYRKGKEVCNHPRYHVLQFEDLVKDPEKSLRVLSGFLKVDFEPSMLDVPRVGSSNLRHEERKRGISSEVVDVWRGKLPPAEQWICEKMAGRWREESNFAGPVAGFPAVGLLFWLLVYPLHVLGVMLMNPRIAMRVLRALLR